MNIRQAILKAADSIEQNPELFEYQESIVPDCRSPGCALGWIGHHLGMQGKDSMHNVMPLLGYPETYSIRPFSTALDDLVDIYSGWRRNAIKCAQVLRLYADKYHSDHIPESVREIFKEVVDVDREIRDAKF